MTFSGYSGRPAHVHTRAVFALSLLVLAMIGTACVSDEASEPGTPARTVAGSSTAETVVGPTATPVPASTPAPDGVVEQWPMFRLDLQRTGASGETGISTPPALRWRSFTGGPVESSPAVVDGVLYVGTFDRHLFALDAKTGEEMWRFEVDGLVRGSPSVVDGAVYFGADGSGFFALDAETGEPRWTFPLGRVVQQSSAAIADGAVYFGAFDGNMYALDAGTGRELWRFATGGVILSSPALTAGMVLFGSGDGLSTRARFPRASTASTEQTARSPRRWRRSP